MPFIVVEKDEFVRTDLVESLIAAFPDEPVRSLDRPEDTLTALAETAPGKYAVALIAASVAEVRCVQKALGEAAANWRFILLDEDTTIGQSDDRISCLSRPFSSEMLIDAVRNVLGHPLGFR